MNFESSHTKSVVSSNLTLSLKNNQANNLKVKVLAW